MKYRLPTAAAPIHVYGRLMMKKSICAIAAARTRYCQPGRRRGRAQEREHREDRREVIRRRSRRSGQRRSTRGCGRGSVQNTRRSKMMPASELVARPSAARPRTSTSASGTGTPHTKCDAPPWKFHSPEIAMLVEERSAGACRERRSPARDRAPPCTAPHPATRSRATNSSAFEQLRKGRDAQDSAAARSLRPAEQPPRAARRPLRRCHFFVEPAEIREERQREVEHFRRDPRRNRPARRRHDEGAGENRRRPASPASARAGTDSRTRATSASSIACSTRKPLVPKSAHEGRGEQRIDERLAVEEALLIGIGLRRVQKNGGRSMARPTMSRPASGTRRRAGWETRSRRGRDPPCGR